MKVTNVRGVLPNRDASLEDLNDEMFVDVSLEEYLKSTRIRRESQDGEYTSNSGTNIEPVPLWAISFQTSRRKIGNQYQVVPKKRDGLYQIATADWASEVRGVGKEKEKWRGTRLEGDCSPSSLFSVATSSYLVPYAIGHRYITHLPASVEGKGTEASVTVHHEYANYENHQLSSWNGVKGSSSQSRDETRGIKEWTIEAQKIWEEKRTPDSKEKATEYLNYYNKLSRQPVKSYRVVHTRSRKLYAAVLEPKIETALGLPLGSAKIKRRINGDITQTDLINVEGVICDNLVNYITVESEMEAYWLMGLLNADAFEEKVMEIAKGDPPNIYSIPAKLLNRMEISFDPDDPLHTELAEIAEALETSMMSTIEHYIENEKGIDLDVLDDSDRSPEIPNMVITAYVNRLNEDEKEERLNEIGEIIVGRHE